MAQPDTVAVRVGARGYRAEVVAGDHSLIADEPVALGGTNEGPTPYDYLAAALGTCTAMTIRMYADRREWPLDEVTVRLTHSRTHQKDCAQCDEGQVGIDQFARSIELSGDLTDEQRAGLLRVADRCPVAQTLKRGVSIVSIEPVPTTT